MTMAAPDVIRLMPTISPSAQLAVLGHPLMISPAEQIDDTACQHPSPGVGKHVAITEGCNDLEDAFDDEEGDEHQSQRDGAFNRMPKEDYADKQRERCCEERPEEGLHVCARNMLAIPTTPLSRNSQPT